MRTPTRRRSRSEESTEIRRARLAQLWSEGQLSGKHWITDPHGIPRVMESEQISLRLPKKLLAVIRTLAERRGIGYQVLLKDWLYDRAHIEAERELGRDDPAARSRSPVVVALPMSHIGIPADECVDSDDPRFHLKKKVT